MRSTEVTGYERWQDQISCSTDAHFLDCRWLDEAPDTWEFEDHLAPALIQAFESGEAGAFEKLAEPGAGNKPVSKRAARRAKKEARRAAQAANGTSEDRSASLSSSDPLSHQQKEDESVGRTGKVEELQEGSTFDGDLQDSEVREVVSV